MTKPFFTQHNPINEIQSVEIFPPEYDDLGALCYPVLIDDLELTFHMDQQGTWQYKEKAILPPKVLKLVGVLIDKSRR